MIKQYGFIRPAAWLQVLIITLIFGAAFLGMRRLPNAQCGFLHYEVTEVLADGTEVCAATNHSKFIDLDALTYPVNMVLLPEHTPAVGESVPFRVQFLDQSGNRLLPHELAVTHTERIHLMVVDRSLGDYHHIHPEPDGNTGEYTFNFTPEHGGPYRFFAEIVPVRTKRQAIASTWLQVEGSPPDAYAEQSPGPSARSEWKQYRFELLPEVERIRTNRDNALQLRVTREDRQPVELQEVMGAQAHLVAFDSGKSGFAHMHPATLDTVSGVEPTIPFYFYTPKGGAHRIWAQVRLEGEDVFVPFDLQVE